LKRVKPKALQLDDILNRLKTLADSEAVAGMARYGINPATAYGVSIPNLRKIAREAGKNHELALKLWDSGIHEARILAGMIERPAEVTEQQMEAWARDFNSWDLCDQCCNNLFRKLAWAHDKAVAWTAREEEFVKRAGFVLMACLAVHDKNAEDAVFVHFLTLIESEAADNRNFVKKAVNWALRQIGKRNLNLNRAAIRTAEQISKMHAKAAKWIAADALRELAGEGVQARLGAAPTKKVRGRS
jgi:3-methyladenine DNA glycosylase AlkD